jgi:hypothetical protein
VQLAPADDFDVIMAMQDCGSPPTFQCYSRQDTTTCAYSQKLRNFFCQQYDDVHCADCAKAPGHDGTEISFED